MVRGSKTGAQAQPEDDFAKIVQTISPLPDGGLLPRALIFKQKTERKTMNNEIVICNCHRHRHV